MPSPQGAASKLAKTLQARFETRRRIAVAVVTAVQRDSAGRAIGATASVDGLVAQRLYIDIGASIQVGDVFEVVNRGGAATPAWYTMRRLSTTIAVPQLPFGTTLPAPTALALTTDSYVPTTGAGSLAWIYASFKTVDPVYGPVGYECECRPNDAPDDDDPIVMSRVDPRLYTTLAKNLGSTPIYVARMPTTADFDFARAGIIQIDSELISYTYATRRQGIWVAASMMNDTNFQLLDFVDDLFTDTDTTNITAHTPDYDRDAGGWYVIPTYSSNWAISSNKVVATPGGTWPYSAALIREGDTWWGSHRLRGDWTWPSSGQFGYIIDYDDASNFVYVRYDMTNQQFEIVERIGAAESTVWSQADDTLTATETYTFEVQVVLKTVYIKVSGGDLTEDIEYEATDALTNQAASSAPVGIWSDVAVTLDNFHMDDARERDSEDHEWAYYVYCEYDSALTYLITDNERSAHSDVFWIGSGPPIDGIGTIHPAFTGCTRGYGGTTPASHLEGAGIYAQSLGFMITGLVGGIDYNVRVRAVLSDTIVSPWTDWSTIVSAEDTSAPDAPDGLAATGVVNGAVLTWDEYATVIPDLAGFKIYRATDSSGTGATLVATTSSYEQFVSSAAGEVFYYNIKAFDFTGNVSGYGEVTWVEGTAVYTDGTNLIPNSDFERDWDGDSEADGWDDYANAAWGSYGMSGGHGYRIDPPVPTTIPTFGFLVWDPADNGYEIKAVEGQYLVVSVYLKPDSTMEFCHPDLASGTTCYPMIWFSNGSTPFGGTIFTFGGDDFYGVEALADGWYRAWGRHKVTASDISSTPYVGVGVGMLVEGSDRYCDVDRIQLELGYEPSQWKPDFVAVYDGSGMVGLMMDAAGIVSDSFMLDVNGLIASNLEPAASNTYDHGAADAKWRDGYYGGNLDVDGNIVVDGTVDGVDVQYHQGRHQRGGSDELDGDHLDIDWNPSNYTPSTAPSEAGNVDDLTAHLYGIDQALGAGGGGTDDIDSQTGSNGSVVVIGTTGTTLVSLSVTVPTGYRVFASGQAAIRSDGMASQQIQYVQLYDGTSAKTQAVTMFGGNTVWIQVGLSWISTKTGTYTFYLRAYKADSSNTIRCDAGYAVLNVLIYPEKT